MTLTLPPTVQIPTVCCGCGNGEAYLSYTGEPGDFWCYCCARARATELRASYGQINGMVSFLAPPCETCGGHSNQMSGSGDGRRRCPVCVAAEHEAWMEANGLVRCPDCGGRGWVEVDERPYATVRKVRCAPYVKRTALTDLERLFTGL